MGTHKQPSTQQKKILQLRIALLRQLHIMTCHQQSSTRAQAVHCYMAQPHHGTLRHTMVHLPSHVLDYSFLGWDGSREIEGKRKRLQELAAARDVDSDAALQRLRETEMRRRADVTAAQSSNTAARARLVDAKDPDFRKLQALQDAAAKRGRKRDEMEAKATRLRTKIASLQVWR